MAIDLTRTSLVSPEGSFNVANFPSRAISCANEPALLAKLAPFPGVNSTQQTAVPSGIDDRGIEFPILGSTFSPDTTLSPTFKPFRATMYLFSPSSNFVNAIKADLLGSYSIVKTSASSLNLSLLKSISLYFFLWPPPLNFIVIRP